MRHTIEFDFTNRWALTTFHGPVHVDEVVELLKRVVELPQWSPDWDRIIDYSDGMLGDFDVEVVREAKTRLGEVLQQAYAGKPTLSAQVCSDPMKKPLVEYWIGLGAGDYPADLVLFGSVAEARSWLLQNRSTIR